MSKGGGNSPIPFGYKAWDGKSPPNNVYSWEISTIRLLSVILHLSHWASQFATSLKGKMQCVHHGHFIEDALFQGRGTH